MRETIMKYSAIATLVAGTAGCTTWDMEELQATAPEGDRFQQALAGEYLAFAQSEAAQYDWVDSRHFARKGLIAAKAGETAPEAPDDWRLPRETVAAIGDARQRLLAAFAADARGQEPTLAARAQLHYDCWLEQQEENWQTDHIAACRDGLAADLDRLEVALKLTALPDDASAVVHPAALTYMEDVYVLRFEHDRVEISPTGQAILKKLLRDVRLDPDARIAVHGHADRSGRADYNLSLSGQRAQAVVDALTEAGIPSDAIEMRMHGETNPAVETPDGTREAQNRRVEIFVQ